MHGGQYAQGAGALIFFMWHTYILLIGLGAVIGLVIAAVLACLWLRYVADAWKIKF